MRKKDDDEKTKWKHFFEILSRKYVWMPAVLILIWVKESAPITAQTIEHFLNIVK